MMYYIITIATSMIIMCLSIIFCKKALRHQMGKNNNNELYVNYHLTRQCNYKCGFCFHTAKTSHVLTLDEAKRGLKLLADYGMLIFYILSELYNLSDLP